MQHVRIAKNISLIGLVAASLLLCTAQSFEPAPKLYRAKPKDVPPWAEQGTFRFIRIDGGQIESWKAERTWWGDKFSAEEKDVLSHIYDRDFEQMLGLLKQAEFNWIWVTWSSGWSLKDEEENRENLKKVIARCHENGIHVSAYLSASNMFRKSAFRDDPETKKYGLWMHHIPLFYAGPTKTDLQISWDRRLADARKPGWRAYLLKKAEMAVDAGVDAIAWDNMIGYNDGLAQLLDDTQRMAERRARETGRPKVMVEANTGLRVSELLALKWADMDFAAGEIHLSRGIVRQHIGVMKTEASRKPVPLDAGLADVLLGWRGRCPYNKDADYIFASPDKNGSQPYWPNAAMEDHIRPAAKRAGIQKRLGWHTLRHTHGTLIKSQGADAATTQALMRHANASITMDRYVQAVTPAKREAQSRVVNSIPFPSVPTPLTETAVTV